MELSPSAHTDTFCRDNLPPRDQWPELRFDLPELRYPGRLNCAQALLGDSPVPGAAQRPGSRTWRSSARTARCRGSACAATRTPASRAPWWLPPAACVAWLEEFLG